MVRSASSARSVPRSIWVPSASWCGRRQIGHPGLLPGVDGAAYPTLAQMAGHAMSSIFLDSLASDVERLDKMNQITAALSPQERRAIGLRVIETLVISPSERLDGVAAQYLAALPARCGRC